MSAASPADPPPGRPLATLRLLWPHVRAQHRSLFQAAGVTLALTVVEVAIPLLIRAYVDLITHGLYSTVWFWNEPGPVLIAALLVGALLRGLLLARQRALAGRIGELTAAAIRARLWAHIQELPIDHTESRGPGRLLVRFITDIRAVQRIVSTGLIRGTQDVLMGAAVLVVLAALNWRMALPAVLVVPIYAVLFRLLNPRIRQLSAEARRRRTRLSAYLNERIVGMRIVKASVRQASEALRVERLARNLAERGASMTAMAGTLEGAATTAITCSIALALAIAAGEFAAGRATNGTIVAYIMLLGLLAPIFRRIVSLNRSLQIAQVSVDRLASTLATPSESLEGKARTLRVKQGAVAVKRVSFALGSRPILRRVSLRARRGQLVALAGPNGGGKSTLLELILRFQQPTDGRIVIDGRDIANVTLDSLRAQIGWVPQDTLLFDSTIAENIAYGAPNRVSAAKIARIARLAGVDQLTARFRTGLETRVGTAGQVLSHGARQRIALARALITNPPILLLDEVSAGADAGSEQALAELLRALARNKTIIVATHRLPTLMAADRIYVLDRGRLVERGTHQELMARSGIYARLFGRETTLAVG